MKTVFAVIAVLAMVSFAHAAPYLVCDPQTGVSEYRFSGDAYFTTKAAEANGSLRYDVGTIPVGSHTINIQACAVSGVWGTQCSATVPFTFTRPSPPSAPSGTSLVAQ